MNRLLKISLMTLMMIAVRTVAEAQTPTAIDMIKANYREILAPSLTSIDSLTRDMIKIEQESEISDQVVIELHERYPFDIAKIDRYLSAMRHDGSWSDINYNDTKRSGWEPKQHADRVLEMVKLYKTPGSPRYRSAELGEQIHRALDYWFTAKPKCLNWWQNEIGIPKTLGPACILMEDELTPAEREGIIDVTSAARFKMTGQNKVWLAGNVLLRGLLQNDGKLVSMARDTIMSEICVGRAEGIKPDWSFHQHGPQQQFGNYGLAYISSMGFYYKLFDGTPYKFDPEQEQILRSLINEGYKWVVWKRNMDVSALGRQLFHNAQLHKAYAIAFTAAGFGIDGFPLTGNQLVGHKHFDDSDYTIHRTADWMASLKMSSSRVIGTEVVNEDNHLGYYLGDGATYYYIDGDEYRNVFPFWDWRKIPGVTAYEDSAPIPNIRQNK
ncbi:MAG: chondroitinase, partial [Duncaniella sp.]|nr:chondroitinase [Duncaniella sp.]